MNTIALSLASMLVSFMTIGGLFIHETSIDASLRTAVRKANVSQLDDGGSVKFGSQPHTHPDHNPLKHLRQAQAERTPARSEKRFMSAKRDTRTLSPFDSFLLQV
ncbi:hypothetical protein FJZ39_04270 [Candidatus Saccharibacteria bacterium]|nr:hypothetical protein [Candidatus Saccharibacteria bacterium]